MRRVSTTLLLSGFLCLGAAVAHSQSTADSTYTEVFYPSGRLRIQAYLYKPEGAGPFPVVIYNHGLRGPRRERLSVPQEHIGALLTRAGYGAMIVERRGYGRSDGRTLSEEVEDDRKQEIVPRLQAETDDVLAALDYLRTLPFVDAKRIGIMGASHGGIITMFAISRSTAFSVAVDQAGGALTWNGNPNVRRALIAAAEKATTPTFLMVAQNDRTTASITTVAEIFTNRGVPHRVVIYPPFTPKQRDRVTPPGHKLHTEEGVHVWERDVLEFLGRYLGAPSPGTRGGADPAQPPQ